MGDGKPKYVNSPETDIFLKSRNMYGLFIARRTNRDYFILCEGYMDVIALHSAGFENAVATLGTAITSEQARIMSRYTKKVIICYDSDEAGQKAAMRAVKLLSEVGLDVTILKVNGAKDPDEYIKKYGREKFQKLLSESKSKFDYSLENILSKYDINLSNEKIKALTDSERLISETYSSAERDIYIQTVAKLFNVEIKSVRDDVDQMRKTAEKKWHKEESNRVKQDAVGYTDKVNPDFAKAPAVARNEENLLGLLLMYPEHRKQVFEKELVSEEDFITDLNRRIFKYLENAFFNQEDSHFDIDDHFTTDERGRMARMKSVRMELSENGDAVLLDSISNLKKSVSKKQNEKNASLEDLVNLIKKKQNN